MHGNRASSVEEEEFCQIDSADSYVLYSEGKGRVYMYGIERLHCPWLLCRRPSLGGG